MPKKSQKPKFLLKKKFRHRSSLGLLDLCQHLTSEDGHSGSHSSSGYDDESSPANLDDGSGSSSISSPGYQRSIFTQDTILQDVPANYTMRFRRLFPSSDSNDEDRFLSNTTSSCSTLPQLTVEPLPNPKKRKFKEDTKRFAYVNENIRLKCVKEDWNSNFSKYSKKFFLSSFCNSNDSDIRRYCDACTKKTEEEIMNTQRHWKQKNESFLTE